jgi:hypothetical protein
MPIPQLPAQDEQGLHEPPFALHPSANVQEFAGNPRTPETIAESRRPGRVAPNVIVA